MRAQRLGERVAQILLQPGCSSRDRLCRGAFRDLVRRLHLGQLGDIGAGRVLGGDGLAGLGREQLGDERRGDRRFAAGADRRKGAVVVTFSPFSAASAAKSCPA